MRTRRSVERDPVALATGFFAAITVVGIAAAIPLPRILLWPGVAVFLGGGFAGGYVAGRAADGDWRRRRVHGAVSGLLGGVCAGISLAAGMNRVVELQFETALWGVAYGLAFVVPPDLVAEYGAALTVCHALALVVLFAVEGAVAAVAVGGSVSTP